MDSTLQAVLIIMILVLGSTLAMVGIMFAFLLRDVRESITRVNGILEDVREVSTNLATGSYAVEQAVQSIRASLDTVVRQTSTPLSSAIGMFTMVRSLWKKKGGEDE